MKFFAYSDEAFALTDFLSSERCLELIEMTEKIGYTDAPIDTGSRFTVAPEVRNNTRVIVDSEDLAEELWERCKPYVPKVLGGRDAYSLNERFRFYRYDKYQMFKWHSDGSFKRNDRERSRLTFMVYLNDGYDGGSTDFKEFKVWPARGVVLCFEHSLIHEGAPVTRGRKYVLRTDVMYKDSV